MSSFRYSLFSRIKAVIWSLNSGSKKMKSEKLMDKDCGSVELSGPSEVYGKYFFLASWIDFSEITSQGVPIFLHFNHWKIDQTSIWCSQKGS